MSDSALADLYSGVVEATHYYAVGTTMSLTTSHAGDASKPVGANIWAAAASVIGTGTTASIAGSDSAGVITLATTSTATSSGGSVAGGKAVSVYFNTTYRATPSVIILQGRDDLSRLLIPYLGVYDNAHFELWLENPTANSQTYRFFYFVMG